MANIPGLNTVVPGVYTNTTTTPRGGSVNVGNRVAAIIGTGETDFNIITNAKGNGADGYDPTYTYTNTNVDGRHFLLVQGTSIVPPYVPGLTNLYKNGTKLTGIEQPISTNTTFSTAYQYRFDPTTGKIELQVSTLQDFGGFYYNFEPISTAKTGTLGSLQLVDQNAITQQWLVRCVKVQYGSNKLPVAGTAQFIAIGGIQNQLYDSNGNPIIWVAGAAGSAVVQSNGVLSFSVIEDPSNPYIPGDQFVVQVQAQILAPGDTLSATCVPQSIINDPVTYTNLNDVYTYHGLPSTDNTLSLGCELAFENGASSVIACQAAPPLPIRTTISLTEDLYNIYNPTTISGGIYNKQDFIFPLPYNFVPDTAYDVHVFDTDTSGNTTQILLNQFTGTLGPTTVGTTVGYDDFIRSGVTGISPVPPNTWVNNYALFQQNSTYNTAFDGVVTPAATTIITSGTAGALAFATPTVTLTDTSGVFSTSLVGKSVVISDSTNSGNNGTFVITAATPTSISFSNLQGHTSTGVTWSIPNYSNYQMTFSSATVFFDNTYVGKWITPIDSANAANMDLNPSNPGCFQIEQNSIFDGKVTINLLNVTPSGFYNQTSAVSAGATVSYSLLDVNGNVITTYQVGSTNIPLPGATNGVYTDTQATLSAGSGGISTFVAHAFIADFATIVAAAGTLVPIAGIKIISCGTSALTLANKGTYNVISDILTTGSFVIQKTFVLESNLRFEVIDPTQQSYYFIINALAIQNGHGLSIHIVSEDSGQFVDVGWENALASLEKIECDIVVPLPNQTITPIFQNTIAHCISMSSLRNKKERVPLIGAITGLMPQNVIGSNGSSTPVAVENLGPLEGIQGSDVSGILIGEDIRNYSIIDSYGTINRCAYMYPDMITKTLVKTAEVTNIDGYFMTAALAGYITAQSAIQEPVTNKVLNGFSIPRSRVYSPTTIEQLTQSGALVVQPTGASGGLVVWGITTTQSGVPEEQELSILFIRDMISKMFRSLFNRFIGTAERPETLTDLNICATEGVKIFVTQGLITQYRNISIAQDPVEPRQWNVGVEVQPTYGINWIYITTKVNYFTSTS
jgi:hypothetical protein